MGIHRGEANQRLGNRLDRRQFESLQDLFVSGFVGRAGQSGARTNRAITYGDTRVRTSILGISMRICGSCISGI